MPKRQASVAVIGAGIAGATAAFRLKSLGFEPVIFEAADYVGGRVKSIHRGPYTFDVGAFICLGSYQETLDLIHESGLTSQLSRADAYGAMPRNGRLQFLDFKKPVRTIVGTPYLSASAKLKALKLFALLARNWSHLNYEDAGGVAELDTDSVRTYCERELSPELMEYVASVVVRGPWLQNIDTASIAQLLWTMKNFFKPHFYNLDEGMAALPRRLVEGCDLRLNNAVTQVANRGDSVELHWTDSGGTPVCERFDSVVMTATADRVLKMMPQLQGTQRQFFADTRYNCSVNTHIVLREAPSNPATYIMVAPSENPELCGVIVDHKKARRRVPDGQGMMTVFCRHEWCERHLDASNDQVVSQVLSFIRPYYGDLSNDIVDVEVARWTQVVPFMQKGRFRQMAEYQRAMDPRARVQFANDLLPIGGVNAALVSGEKAARRVAACYA